MEGLLECGSEYIGLTASVIITDELLEGSDSGGVEETAVGTVIVVSLNRTSAM